MVDYKKLIMLGKDKVDIVTDLDKLTLLTLDDKKYMVLHNKKLILNIQGILQIDIRFQFKNNRGEGGIIIGVVLDDDEGNILIIGEDSDLDLAITLKLQHFRQRLQELKGKISLLGLAYGSILQRPHNNYDNKKLEELYITERYVLSIYNKFQLKVNKYRSLYETILTDKYISLNRNIPLNRIHYITNIDDGRLEVLDLEYDLQKQTVKYTADNTVTKSRVYKEFKVEQGDIQQWDIIL